MQTDKRKLLPPVFKLLLFLVLTTLFGCVFFRYYQPAAQFVKGNMLVLAVYAVVLYRLTRLYGACEIGFAPVWELAFSGSLAIVFTNVIAYVLICLIANKSFLYISFLPLWALSSVQILIFAAGSAAGSRLYRKLHPAAPLLAVCSQQDFPLLDKLQAAVPRYRIHRLDVGEGYMPPDAWEAAAGCRAIFIGTIRPDLRQALETYCYAQNKKVYLAPSIPDILKRYAANIQALDAPVFLCRNKGPSFEQLLLKRLMDITLSGAGLILASPLMLAVALAIKLCDGGPVFFSQRRVTRGNRIFTLYKFRSMVVDAEADGAQKMVDGDRRVTPVGRVIRACRLDELPQLVNILLGDMSLVGPRPERCENVEEYARLIPEFPLRHKMKAGLTGYAQVYGRYNTSPRDKLHMDLLYIEDYSLLLDLKILLLTVKTVFMRESAQGF